MSVPVLSEQITDTDPNASTDGSFFTIAFRLLILNTPSASVTVVTMGRPSGMAATARDTGLSRTRSGQSCLIGNPCRIHDGRTRRWRWDNK